jgi:hypothetical protein
MTSRFSRAAKRLAMLLGLAALSVAGSAAAAPVLNERDLIFTLSYSDAAFDNASLHRTAEFQYLAQAPFTQGVGVGLNAGGHNFTTFADGGLSIVSDTGTNPHILQVASNGSAGDFGFSYDFPPNNAPGFPIKLGVTNGLPTLSFNLNGAAGGFNTHLDTFTAILPGDWSQAGMASGDHEFLGVNPAFFLTQDFVYYPGIKATIVQAVDPNYVSGQQINLEFNLFGSAVPEPATWAMALLGVAFAGAALRRRRGSLAELA